MPAPFVAPVREPGSPADGIHCPRECQVTARSNGLPAEDALQPRPRRGRYATTLMGFAITNAHRSSRGALFREESAQRFELSERRFEVIETTLRDLAQQLIMLGRGVKVLLETRRGSDDRFDALEKVDAIEQRGDR